MRSRVLHGYTQSSLGRDLSRLNDEGFVPTLAFLFADPRSEFCDLAGRLSLQGIQVIGCTSSAEIHGNRLLEGSMVVVLLELDPAAFRIAFQEYDAPNRYRCMEDLQAEIRPAIAGPDLFLLSAKPFPAISEQLPQLRQQLPSGATLMAAVAGTPIPGGESIVFSSHYRSDRGLVCLALDCNSIQLTSHPAWQKPASAHSCTLYLGTAQHIPGQHKFDAGHWLGSLPVTTEQSVAGFFGGGTWQSSTGFTKKPTMLSFDPLAE